MKKSIMTIALVACLGLLGSGIAAARPGLGVGGPGYGIGGQQGVAQLDDATLQQREQFLNETLDLRRQINSKRTELQAVLRAANPDEARATSLSNELFDLQEQMRQKAQTAGISGRCGMGGGACGGGACVNQ